MINRRDSLTGKLDRFLDRRAPPARMGEQAQLDEAAALFRAVDRLAPERGYEDWWTRFEDALGRLEKTRSWPIVSELYAAAETLKLKSPLARGSADEEPPEIYEMVKDWFLRHGDAMPSTAKPHHAAQLVEEGVATYGELHRAGFPILRNGYGNYRTDQIYGMKNSCDR